VSAAAQATLALALGCQIVLTAAFSACWAWREGAEA